MSGKVEKRYRAAAYAEASRRQLWKKGEDSFMRWYRRLLAWLFPRLRRRYFDLIGRWYKRNLKSFARQARAFMHDRDAQAFAAAQRKAEKKRVHARLAAAQAAQKESTL